MTEGQTDSARAIPRLRWWREVLYVIAFYAVYSAIRIRIEGSQSVARENAFRIIDAEKLIGTFHEESIQEAFLDWPVFISFWNVFYGTFHFVVTVFALVYMFRRATDRYPLWRNTLAFTTGFALIGFVTFPLMPPRLMPELGFVDTLASARYQAIWSFQSGAMKAAANAYAAMPSLHIGWAGWCACVLLPHARQWWSRALVVVYPVLTLFAIVVTANHFWLDAVGGIAVLGAGYLAARAFTPWIESLTRRTGNAPIP